MAIRRGIWRGEHGRFGARRLVVSSLAARVPATVSRRCSVRRLPEVFLPIVHLVFSNLKSWLNGTHHGVSHQHLQAYLNEFTFRFNRRHYPFSAFRSLLGIASDATAPTYAELYSGEWRHPGPTKSSGCG